MSLLDPETRKALIKNAVLEVLSAGLGSFCSIYEKKTGKIEIVLEATGEAGKVLLKIEGELTDEQLAKVSSIVEGLQGDVVQQTVEITGESAPELVEKIFSDLLGTKDFDIEIETVTS